MSKMPLEIDFRKKVIDEFCIEETDTNLQLDVNRLQIIIDTIPIPIYHKNAEGEYTGCNMSFEKAMGISRERLIGKTIFDFADNYSAGIINSLEQDAIQTRTVKESEELLKYFDGTIHNVIIRKAPFLNSDWQPGGVVGVIFDITEQKAAEDALKHRIELDTIVTAASTNFIQTKTIDINDGIKQTMSRVNEFLNSEHCYLYMLSEDKKSYKLNYSTYSRPVEQMEVLTVDFVQSFSWGFNKLKKFEVINLSLNSEFTAETLDIRSLMQQKGISALLIIPLVFANELKGFLGFECYENIVKWNKEDLIQLETIADIFINALERKQTEEALEKEKEELSVTLKSIGDGVITTNLLDQIVMVNTSAEEITGWKQSELCGMNVTELFKLISIEPTRFNNNQQKQELIDRIKKLAYEDFQDDKFFIVSKETTKKTVAISSAELNDKRNKVRGFVYVIRDITKIQNIEKQLTLSQKMESVGQLAAGIAHEINTPMQYIGDNTIFLKDSIIVISRFIEEMRELIKSAFESNNYSFLAHELKKLESELDVQYLIEEIPVAIHQTQAGIQHVSKIVLAMKDFAHPSAKEKSLVNINKGIEVTTTISKNEWKYFSELELALSPDLPEVFCVLDEINQVILNMIVNANDAIKEANLKEAGKKGTIKIETGVKEKFIFIKISDNGTGIKNEHSARVFDPFFTTKEVGKGTGQGLSIAHDIIVNKHNGNIVVDSIPGKGTTFTIHLPMTERE